MPMVGFVTRAGWSKLLSKRMDMLCTRCRTNFIFLDKSVQHVQICSPKPSLKIASVNKTFCFDIDNKGEIRKL